MLLSKGYDIFLYILLFRSSFLILSGCCRPEVNQIKIPALCSSKNLLCWAMCFVILFSTLIKLRDLSGTFHNCMTQTGHVVTRKYCRTGAKATAQRCKSLSRSSGGFIPGGGGDTCLLPVTQPWTPN